MPGALRSRLRRVLTGQEGEGGALSKIKHRKDKTPKVESDFYQPGEKMPPLKYRRPVDPAHKMNLEAFSFKKAWRRRSHQSLYSPMGSRLPSRKGSFRSRRSRSRSVHRSRRSSFHSELADDEDETWVDSGIGASISGDERPANIREASDDEGDVLNVGLSRNPTQDPRDAQRDAQRKESAGRRRSSSVKSTHHTRPNTGSDRTRQSSQPFSAEDLEQALQKSHLDAKKLEATKEESDRSNGTTPSDDDASPFDNLRPRGGSIFIPHDSESPGLFPGWSFVPATGDTVDDVGAHYQRRESYFTPIEAPDSPQFPPRESADNSAQFQRRPSVFVPNDEAEPAPAPRRPSVFVPETASSARRPSAVPTETPSVTPSTHKTTPASGPSDEIMKILSRKD